MSAGPINIDTDQRTGGIEVEDHARRHFTRVGTGTIGEVDVERVGVGLSEASCPRLLEVTVGERVVDDLAVLQCDHANPPSQGRNISPVANAAIRLQAALSWAFQDRAAGRTHRAVRPQAKGSQRW
jgi:hypothetical protein